MAVLVGAACGGTDGATDAAVDSPGSAGDVVADTTTPEAGADAGADATAAIDVPGDGGASTGTDVPSTWSDGPAPQCRPLGGNCDPSFPAIPPCCAGLACDSTLHCVLGAGASCADGGLCAFGTTCNATRQRCEPVACIDATLDAVCSALPGVPCCDMRARCTADMISGGPTIEHCCIPDGTVVPMSDAARCCSNSTERAPDAGVRCIPRPPH